MKPLWAQRKANVYQYGFEVNFEWSDWARNLTNYDVYKHLNKAQYHLEKNKAEYCKGNVHYVV